jgi:hypothetical protein
VKLCIFLLLLALDALCITHQNRRGNLLRVLRGTGSLSHPDSVSKAALDILRRVQRGRYFALLIVFLGALAYGLFFLPWYIAMMSPVFLGAGIFLWGLILPDYSSAWYLERFRRTLRRLQVRGRISDEDSQRLLHWIEGMTAPVRTGSGPTLTQEERDRAAGIRVHLVWYDDKFEYFSGESSSFLAAVCLKEEEAIEFVRRRPLHGDGNYGDGYELGSEVDLLEGCDSGIISVEQVRQILRGESPSGAKMT